MKIYCLLIVTLCALAGCGKPKPTTPPPAPPATSYPLTGIVRKVDVKTGTVTLRHEAIPGYMDAMTMPFEVASAERATLDDLQVGDKISATLDVTEQRSSISRITITELAEPPTLILDTSGNSPTLRTKKLKLQPGELVPDFTLELQDGAKVKLSEFRGKVIALTFIYTRCPRPDFCPRVDSKFAELSRAVGAIPARVDKVRLLSVSFDPAHDTPEVLAKHAALKGAKAPLWQFAVASHDELKNVAEPLGLTYGPTENEIVHNLSTAIIGPDRKLISLFEGSSWAVEDAFKAIKSGLAQ